MSKIAVPAAPTVELKARDEQSGEMRASASKTLSPLDAAFLSRVYRSMAWFGAVITVLAVVGTRSAPVVSSLLAGLVLAALLLRAQEVGVRTLMRPASQLGGLDARLILVLVLPLKFLVLGGALFALQSFGLIDPGVLALGFFAGQLVIVAKVAGLMLARAVKN